MPLTITGFILLITVAVSLAGFSNSNVVGRLSFSPYNVHHHKEWYRTITHMLVHGDFIHLLLNMYVFYIFGSAIEDVFVKLFGVKGNLYYVLLYLGGGLFATVTSFKRHRDNPLYQSVGASGAVAAVILSYVLIAPLQTFLVYFIPMPAFVFGILYIGAEYYLDKRGKGNIAHDAHLAGALFGLFFTIAIKPVLIVEFFQQIYYYFQS